MDKDSFDLDFTTKTIPIVAEVVVDPSILSSSVITVKKTNVKIKLTTDQLGFIYYVVADKNMPVPIFTDVRDKINNNTLKYSNPIFGVTYVKSLTLTVEFEIKGLVPNHDYQVFAFIMNMNKLFSKSPKILSFKTLGNNRINIFFDK